FVVSVWRPRRPDAPVSARPTDPDDTPNGADHFPVRSTDLVYASRARAEAAYWDRIEFGSGFFELLRAGDREVNVAYTGDPARSWIEDLIARGPFGTAAVLGCDEGGYERFWLDHNGSRRLDVYELSPGVIRKVRAGLGRVAAWPSRRVRFIRTDLNFV